jgi:hypothetical protein
MVERLEHPLKALLPIEVTFSGIITLVKSLHPLNALLPILVTLLGITTESKDVQAINAFSSMVSTPFGIFTFSNALQLVKAPAPMLVGSDNVYLTSCSPVVSKVCPVSMDAVSMSSISTLVNDEVLLRIFVGADIVATLNVATTLVSAGNGLKWLSS